MSELSDSRNYFTFDNVPSTNFSLFINGNGTFDGTSADLSLESVPGKSGDLIKFNNRYQNVDVTYTSWIAHDMRTNLRNLRSFLLSRTSYKRLEDTYHPDEFRLAVFSSSIVPSVSFENTLAEFDIVFSCKPQRYLKSGETAVTCSGESLELVNPTYFDSKPLIRIYGNGTLTVGSKQIIVSNNANNYLDLDCEIMDAYTGSVNRNADIVTSDNDFITLHPGTVGISKSSGITSFVVTPRWFTL